MSEPLDLDEMIRRHTAEGMDDLTHYKASFREMRNEIVRLHAENEELRQRPERGGDVDGLVQKLRDRATALVDGPMMSTVRQQIEWEAAEEIERLRAENEKLREALAPFARAAAWFDEHPVPFPQEEVCLWGPTKSHGPNPAGITLADLLQARAALGDDQ